MRLVGGSIMLLGAFGLLLASGDIFMWAYTQGSVVQIVTFLAYACLLMMFVVQGLVLIVKGREQDIKDNERENPNKETENK